MAVSEQVAQHKKENNLPIFDPERERQKLYDIAKSVGPELAPATDAMFSLLFDLSRTRQHQLIAPKAPLEDAVAAALAETPADFPDRPLLACQGVEGAFSQQAAERIAPACNILYFNTFDGVFSAIEKGLCRYGVLPIENSTAGSVNRIYDLMMSHDFSIVKSIRVKVDHCLLVNPGTKLSDIREIISHEQALSQCANFLKSMPGVKSRAVENTAMAAKTVFESGRKDIAALSSLSCAAIYGLECLKRSMQDQQNNYTRFICISRKPEIYPGANRTSLMMVLPHTKGSLYRVISVFNALGVNLLKLESRPLPSTDFEFMFYFDVECAAGTEKFAAMLRQLDALGVTLKYLGTYSEVV